MRVADRSRCGAQAILESRQRTLESQKPLDTDDYDRREMGEAKADVTRPFPSSCDPHQD